MTSDGEKISPCDEYPSMFSLFIMVTVCYIELKNDHGVISHQVSDSVIINVGSAKYADHEYLNI